MAECIPDSFALRVDWLSLQLLYYYYYSYSYYFQVLCASNPDSRLNNVLRRLPQSPPRRRSPSPTHVVARESDEEFLGPCEKCKKLVPLAILVKHEVKINMSLGWAQGRFFLLFFQFSIVIVDTQLIVILGLIFDRLPVSIHPLLGSCSGWISHASLFCSVAHY